MPPVDSHWHDELTVCIVGLGLMGGSLALAWRAAGGPRRIVGVGRNQETLAAAAACGAIDAGTISLAEGMQEANVVVLATPVRTILHLLPEIGRYARNDALVLDLGSSKQQICAAMSALPDRLQAIGGHPLCGKERAGFAAAAADLFRDRPFVLCPLARTSDATLQLAIGLVEAAGGRPIILDPATHDRAVAAISHLPYAVAVALVAAVAADGDTVAWSLASSGFRDTSRVAASDVDMMLDTLLTNREAVVDWIDTFSREMAGLRAELAATDELSLRARLSAAKERRSAFRA